jgi:hypothetical protein
VEDFPPEKRFSVKGDALNTFLHDNGRRKQTKPKMINRKIGKMIPEPILQLLH